MYHLVRSPNAMRRVAAEAPSLVGALVVAEFFFKWHSFLLECLGFLAAWFVLSWASSLVFGVAASLRRSRAAED